MDYGQGRPGPRRSGAVAAVAVLLALPLALPARAGAEQERPRVIAVGGEGEVATRPDRARLQLGVTHTSLELHAAENEVNRIVRAYIVEARHLGVKEEQLSTTGAAVQPEYVWDEQQRSNRLVGYRVSRDIALLVTDLDKLGAHLLAATKVGINQVQPPQLESSRAKELQGQALVKAAQDAQAKARLLADALAVKLGGVRSIGENLQGQPLPMVKTMAMRSEAVADGNAEMGLQAGEIRYRATVSAEFDLLP